MHAATADLARAGARANLKRTRENFLPLPRFCTILRAKLAASTAEPKLAAPNCLKFSPPPPHSASHLAPPPDEMPPRRRSTSGYRGVRVRPCDTFYADIRSGAERIGLDTFETAHEAACTYDAVAWRLGRCRRTMNFHDMWTREQVESLAPPPPAVTREQQ